MGKEEVSSKRDVKSFVLRQGRLKKSQEEALTLYSKEYVLPFKEEKIDFEELFGNPNPVVIEIGFGMGSATFQIAQARRDLNFLAIEVFLTGFAKLLNWVGQSELNNIRLIRFDAVEVLTSMIEDNSVAGFHIFFPDPWPKKRHHKRRLIQPPFVELLTKKLKSGGYIYAVTDWQEYGEQILEVLGGNYQLVNPSKGFAVRKNWRPVTSFERKGVAQGHQIWEVWVEKPGD
jgi:tRNA (guanine-N7-)-methyltransferase